MIRHHIRINIGDNERTITFYFVHKDYNTISIEESEKRFNEAVTELNKIYKSYGRFATEVGVTNLFEQFGFERTIP